MGQAAKYAVLIAALAVLIVSATAVGQHFISPSLFNGINNGISRGLATVGSVFDNVRGAINYFLGGGAAGTALNVVLWLHFLFSAIAFGFKLSVTVYRWINQ